MISNMERRRVCIIVSICCPHFWDKAEFLLRLGDALVATGHHVRLVLAGREACSHIIRLHEDQELCSQTFHSFYDDLLKRYAHFDPIAITDADELETSVNRIWTAIVGQPRDERAYGGYLLHEICKASLARRFKQPLHNLTSIDISSLCRIEDAFHKDSVRHILHYRRLFSKWQPHVAIFFGGHFHQDRCAFLVSREMNIQAVAIESSFIPDKIYWDDAGVTGNRGGISSFSVMHQCEALASNEVRQGVVNHMLMSSLGITESRWESRDKERERTRMRLNVGEQNKLILFLAQVPYDTSVVCDGGDFSDQTFAMKAVFETLKLDNNYKFLVRLHPKDNDSDLQTQLHSMTDNTGVISVSPRGESRRDLFDDLVAADLAVTVNSQAGLQAAWCGLPVLLLGRAFYGQKGFTFDVLGQSSYLAPAFRLATSGRATLSRKLLISYLSLLESKFLIDIHDINACVMKLTKLLS